MILYILWILYIYIYFAQCGRPERVIKRRIRRILANSRSLWPYSEINVQVIITVKGRDPGQKWNAKWRGKREKWIVARRIFPFSFFLEDERTIFWKRLDWKIWKSRERVKLKDSKICKILKRRVLIIQEYFYKFVSKFCFQAFIYNKVHLRQSKFL